MDEKINRYPSVRAFLKSEASLFMGRDKEVRLLFNKVVAEKMVLLFARSGIGKSSLINAGLVPLLESRGFLPVQIRMSATNDPADTPLQIFRNFISDYVDQKKFDQFTEDLRNTGFKHEPGLWAYFKCCTFPLAFTPVLIFDQFEQFFGFDTPMQDQFLQQFNQLMSEFIPDEYWEWYISNQHEDIKERYRSILVQPELKVVFAIRSDKIFEMNRLSQFIPAVLRNRFELYPLEEDEAREAIREPARKENEALYTSPRFEYDKLLLDGIIANLKGQNNVIETTQLQIICSEIENKIIIPRKAEGKIKPGYTVTLKDLDSIGGIKKIIKSFYQNQIKCVGDDALQELARILIVDNLYDQNGHSRKILFKEAVVNILNTSKESSELIKLDKTKKLMSLDNEKFINKLLDLRLIREDYRENRKFYEISHDYLLNVIYLSAEDRKRKKLADANAKLKRENDELERLRKLAKNNEELALHKQKDAERATEKAKQALRDADLARNNLKRLKRRNELAAVIIILVILLGSAIFYSYIIRNKNALSRRIATICNYEARNRYNIGDRVLAYVLWDTATYYDPGRKPPIEDTLKKGTFPPFISSLNSSDIQVSDDLQYVGTKYANNRFIAWTINDSMTNITKVVSSENVREFYMLPNNMAVVIDTSGRPYYCNLDGDTTFRRFDLPNEFRIEEDVFVAPVRVFRESNLLQLTDESRGTMYFYFLDSFKPAAELNSRINNLIATKDKGPAAELTLRRVRPLIYSIDEKHLAVLFKSVYYLFQIDNGRSLIEKPIETTRLAYSNSIRKFAFLQRSSVKIFDPFSGRTLNSYPMSTTYRRIIDFYNDSLIVTWNLIGSYEIYNLNQKKTIAQTNWTKYSKRLNMIGYTDDLTGFHLYDCAVGRVIYTASNVADMNMQDTSNIIYLAFDDQPVKKFTVENKNIDSVVTTYKSIPAFYGNKFVKFSTEEEHTLLFQDSTKNKMEYLKYIFREYINQEITAIIGK